MNKGGINRSIWHCTVAAWFAVYVLLFCRKWLVQLQFQQFLKNCIRRWIIILKLMWCLLFVWVLLVKFVLVLSGYINFQLYVCIFNKCLNPIAYLAITFFSFHQLVHYKILISYICERCLLIIFHLEHISIFQMTYFPVFMRW